MNLVGGRSYDRQVQRLSDHLTDQITGHGPVPDGVVDDAVTGLRQVDRSGYAVLTAAGSNTTVLADTAGATHAFPAAVLSARVNTMSTPCRHTTASLVAWK